VFCVLPFDRLRVNVQGSVFCVLRSGFGVWRLSAFALK
jgi:hypothetical protein